MVFYLIFSIWTADIRTKIADFTGINKFPAIFNLFKVLVTFFSYLSCLGIL